VILLTISCAKLEVGNCTFWFGPCKWPCAFP